MNDTMKILFVSLSMIGDNSLLLIILHKDFMGVSYKYSSNKAWGKIVSLPPSPLNGLSRCLDFNYDLVFKIKLLQYNRQSILIKFK